MAGTAELGAVTGEADAPLSFCLDPAGQVRRQVSPEELAAFVRAGRGRYWVDIDSRHEDDWLLLTDLFGFHPLAVEDTRSPHCRVKLEQYEGYLFIVVRGIRFASWTPAPYDIEASNLYAFLGANFLVTVHAEPSRAVDTVAARLKTGTELLGRGVDHLAYMLLDTLVDFYFPLLDEIDNFVDELEDEIFEGTRGEVMQRIFQLKRTLLALRRHLAPMREVMATLANRPTPYLRPETQIYFRDVYDHVIRQVESVETYRDLVTGALETNLTAVSNRLNEVIKTLSVIATVVLPPTLVASIFGMNFEFMPGLEHPYGFWIAIAGMAGVTGGLLYLLWRRGWL